MRDATAIVGLGATPSYKRGASAPQTLEELRTRADYDRFISSQPDNILTVVQVCCRSGFRLCD
jgi:hypothetical protein